MALLMAVGDLDGDGKPDLVTVDNDGSTVSVLMNISPRVTAVEPARAAAPPVFELGAPRLNPSRGVTEIRFVLPVACMVDVNLFDVSGRGVRSLADGGIAAPGEHVLRWDGRDASGAVVRPGIYFLRVRAATRARGGWSW
jgi:hypothetical protein